MSKFLKESLAYAGRQINYYLYDVIFDALVELPQDEGCDDSESESDAASCISITESIYQKAMTDAGQELDYDGFKQYLKERKRQQRMYEQELQGNTAIEEEKKQLQSEGEDLERG